MVRQASLWQLQGKDFHGSSERTWNAFLEPYLEFCLCFKFYLNTNPHLKLLVSLKTTRWDVQVQITFKWTKGKAIHVPLSKKNLKSSMLNEHICAHRGIQYDYTRDFFFLIKVICLSLCLQMLINIHVQPYVRGQMKPPHAEWVTLSVCQHHQVCESALMSCCTPKTSPPAFHRILAWLDGLVRVQTRCQLNHGQRKMLIKGYIWSCNHHLIEVMINTYQFWSFFSHLYIMI